eukprot:74408-Amphidinium_carterae.1
MKSSTPAGVLQGLKRDSTLAAVQSKHHRHSVGYRVARAERERLYGSAIFASAFAADVFDNAD